MPHELAGRLLTTRAPQLTARSGCATGARRGLPSLALTALLTTACGFLPEIPLPDIADPFPAAIGTLPPMPTLAFQDLDPGLLAEPFSFPRVPEGTLQPLTTSPPAWWYLVPIHTRAHTAGSIGRDYHYLVALPAEEVAAYYQQAMRLGGWETFFDPMISGSYAVLHYTRDTADATIYISPRDDGALVSIIIE